MDSNLQTEPSQKRSKPHGKVISMRLDAAFFFERGVRFLERNDLQRALKAFRKTIEYEPENPINHCNLAGVLSEMGDFEASNEILLHVLKEIDPGMAECRFYLANNYANMGQYEAAEECVLGYLDADPDGEYAEEAVEMLDILMDEFGGGRAYARWEAKRKEQEQQSAERDGRHLLESGQFEAAVEWLERVIAREPDNTAARNNLSLAYYYTGQYERAIRTGESVLEKEPDNIHALCNLTVFFAHVGPRKSFEACVRKLKNVFPLNYDHAMKLGTTLGLVSEHAAALSVFRKLAQIVEQPEPALLHSVAAAAANTGQYALAKRWWKTLSQYSDMEEVAAYYMECVERAERLGKPLRVSYQYDLPLQVQFTKMRRRLQQADLSAWRSDPLLRASLYWGLRHGGEETQHAVIRTLSHIGDSDAEKALRAFLKRADISPSLQAVALYALQRMGARGRVELYKDGELTSMRMSEVPRDIILSVNPEWQRIANAVEQWLRTAHKSRYIGEAKQVWIAFVKHAFQRTDFTIGKPDIWVAALIYAVLKRHREPMRQKDIAEAFHVSVSSVSKAAARLSHFFVKMP
jgi:tetratricopeptide (TPR) repeat protein